MPREFVDPHPDAPSWPKMEIEGIPTLVETAEHDGYRRAFVQLPGGRRDCFHVQKEGNAWVPAYSKRYAYVGPMEENRTFEAQERVNEVASPEHTRVTL